MPKRPTTSSGTASTRSATLNDWTKATTPTDRGGSCPYRSYHNYIGCRSDPIDHVQLIVHPSLPESSLSGMDPIDLVQFMAAPPPRIAQSRLRARPPATPAGQPQGIAPS